MPHYVNSSTYSPASIPPGLARCDEQNICVDQKPPNLVVVIDVCEANVTVAAV